MSEDRIRWGVDGWGKIVKVERIGNSYRKVGAVWMKGEDCPDCGHGWWEHGRALNSTNEKIENHDAICDCRRLRGQALTGGTGLGNGAKYFTTRKQVVAWREDQLVRELWSKIRTASSARKRLIEFQEREGRSMPTPSDPLELLHEIKRVLESNLLEPPSKIREARKLLQGLEKRAA